MKKHRKAKLFLEEIRKTPIVSAVCNKLGISRQSVYRWLNEDKQFRILYKEALSQGTDNINDLAESKLIGAIDRSEPWSVKYWLESNSHKYLRPRLPANNIRTEVEDKVDGIDVVIYRTNDSPLKEDSKESLERGAFGV